MNTDLNAKIKLLVKSEKAILNLEMRRKARETLWSALGVVAVLITLVILNITIFLYLTQSFTYAESGAILTIANLLVTILFFVIASRQERSAEAKSIEEIRDFAYEQLASDINEAKESVKEFSQSATTIKQNIESFTNGNAFGLQKVIPLVNALIDITKKR